MSTATELLRRALEALKDAKEEVAEWGAHASPFFREKYDYEGSIKQYDPLIEELALFLASEPEAEPTGYAQKVIEALYENGDPVSIDAAELLERLTENVEPEADEPTDILTIAYQLGYQEGKKFRPKPARKPLSDEEIADIYYNRIGVVDSYLAAFAEGFRQAEKHHLIGVSDE